MREEVLRVVPADLLADVLDAVGSLAALLNSALRLWMWVLRADRGAAFALHLPDEVALDGFNSVEFARLRARLTAATGDDWVAVTLAENGRPLITARLRACEGRFQFAAARPQPFDAEDLDHATQMLLLLQRPFETTVRLGRMWRGRKAANGRKISASALPLSRLEPFPQLRDVELLLIQEALRRTPRRRDAAAALGISDEGLRQKLIRFGLASARRRHRAEEV